MTSQLDYFYGFYIYCLKKMYTICDCGRRANAYGDSSVPEDMSALQKACIYPISVLKSFNKAVFYKVPVFLSPTMALSVLFEVHY